MDSACSISVYRSETAAASKGDAFAAEDLVEAMAVFAVAVTDQESGAPAGEVQTEVACLLGDPGAGGIGRAAGEPDTTAVVSDEEQDVEPAQ